MKTFLFPLLFLSWAASALAQTDLPVPCTLSSRPSDAAIEVDGIPAGSTPATLSLAPGRHAAKLAADGAPATFVEFEVAGKIAISRLRVSRQRVDVQEGLLLFERRCFA